MTGAVRLAAARRIVPLRQGELDGLCGLYAALNAVRLVLVDRARLSAGEIDRLFRHGIELLQAEGRLDAAVGWGMGQRLWRRLAAGLVEQAAECSGGELWLEPLFATGRPSCAAAMTAIGDAVTAGAPVLVLLRETYQHYSVIHGVTPARLLLFDSYGYRWIERASTAVGRSDARARHRLAPRSLLALRCR